MPRSATDVMQEIIFSAVMDSIGALKSAPGATPNTLLRDLNAIHANSTFSDLPREMQAAIAASVRAAFNRLLKEGYSVAQGGAGPPLRPPSRQVPSGPRRPPGQAGKPPRRGPPGKPGGGPRRGR